MSKKQPKPQRFLEIALILISLGLTCLLYQVNGYKMVVLNLFYLPVVLGAFFLGRYRAGILALFCVVSASVVTALDLPGFAAFISPAVIGLALTIWGAVLGLNALLVGTLSDERAERLEELHDAYVGVVEVLSRYLNGADPRLKNRPRRIAELSEQVAARMKLSDEEIDNIRVAALLQDIEHIEVTAKVARRAIGSLGTGKRRAAPAHTFHGSDLVHSLGDVLTGALPLLLDHSENLEPDMGDDSIPEHVDTPFGARIIRTVRSYEALVHDTAGGLGPAEAIRALKNGLSGDHHPAVIDALEKVLHESGEWTRGKCKQALNKVTSEGCRMRPVGRREGGNGRQIVSLKIQPS